MNQSLLEKSDITRPDITVNARDVFGINFDLDVPAFSQKSDYVPELDKNYFFDEKVTKAILAGFAFNRRVLLQGLHGTGKSTHIEQVAARLNWPCIRINLDSHISRIDLIGKDAIILQEGKQVTKFQEGMLPFALQNPIALCFDEYDAGRPDVMFVIQRILEQEGKLTLLDQGRVLTPHPFFRLFGTANTVGLGDTTGLYHGTQQINQGQMDRWNIVARLHYMLPEREAAIINAKVTDIDKEVVHQMVAMAGLTRQAFANGDISILMSPRTVLSWADNIKIFGDVEESFMMSFLNKADESEYEILGEFYQRCFAKDLNAKD
ncbi:MAG: AAA family ATPase [Alphaproteobacteria bacterium]|nr:AAA family ATPase [Alphaproteobacteria bacterium]